MQWRDSPPPGQIPSFEEIVSKIKRRWQGFRPSLVIVVIVLLIVLLSTWFTVQPEETAVVQRFGKVVRTAGPGLHFKLPIGIESVQLVPTARVLKEEFGFRTVAASPQQRTQYASDKAYKGEFYAFSRTVEAYKDGVNKNSVLILTTNSDFYRYLKEAVPGGEKLTPAPAATSRGK